MKINNQYLLPIEEEDEEEADPPGANEAALGEIVSNQNKSDEESAIKTSLSLLEIFMSRLFGKGQS